MDLPNSTSPSQADVVVFEGLLVGMDPVLKIVVQLPSRAQPIPEALIRQVQECLAVQCLQWLSALNAGPRSKLPTLVQLRGVDTVQDLHLQLVAMANSAWPVQPLEYVKACACTAAQLVTDAAQLMADTAQLMADAAQVAVHESHLPHEVLLAQSFKTGVIAMCCAAMKDGLGLHVTTHQQLARVIVATADVVLKVCASSPNDLTSHPAWDYLRSMAVNSSSAAAWPACGPAAGCSLLMGCVISIASCFQLSDMPARFATLQAMMVNWSLSSLESNMARRSSSSSSSSSTTPAGVKAASAHTSSSSSSTQTRRDVTAGSTARANTTDSTVSSSSAQTAAGSGSNAHTNSSSSSKQGSPPRPTSMSPAAKSPNTSLPMDDCALLKQHCLNLGPVLRALADWVPGSSWDVAPLRPALKQYMAAEVDAAASSSSSSQVMSDGPLRRVVLPRYVARAELSLSNLSSRVAHTVQFACMLTNILTADMRESLAQLVCSVAKQVARELVVEKGSAGYEALLQAASYASALVVGCYTLAKRLGIKLLTAQQLVEALISLYDCYYRAGIASVEEDAALRRATALEMHNILCRLTSCRSDSGSGGAVSSSSSSSTPATIAGSPGALDLGYNSMLAFFLSLSMRVEWEGPLSMAAAQAYSDDPSSCFYQRPAQVPQVSNEKIAAAILKMYSPGQVPDSLLAECRQVLQQQEQRQQQQQGQQQQQQRETTASSWGKCQAPLRLKSSIPATAGSSADAKSSGSTGAGSSSALRAAGSGDAAQTNSSNNSSSSTMQGSPSGLFGETPYDMSLPLDDCALLRQHCRNLGPVLGAVADWVAGGSVKVTLLRPAIKQYMAAEVDPAASSRSSSKVVTDGPRRRTLFPRFLPRVDLSLSTLASKVDGNLQLGCMLSKSQSAAMRVTTSEMVAEMAKQVARDLVVEKGSAGYDALLQAASYAGAVIISCYTLNDHLGIKLLTPQQLADALIMLCESYCKLSPAIDSDEALRRATAPRMYSDLRNLVSSSADSSSTGGTRGSSSSIGTTCAELPCGLDDGYYVMLAFFMSLTMRSEWEGPLTKAAAQAHIEEPIMSCIQQLSDPANQLEVPPDFTAAFTADMFPSGMQVPEGLVTGVQELLHRFGAPLQPQQQSQQQKQQQEAEAGSWGKGQALAGLKGFFSKPAAAKPAAAAGKQASAKPAAAPAAAAPPALRSAPAAAAAGAAAAKPAPAASSAAAGSAVQTAAGAPPAAAAPAAAKPAAAAPAASADDIPAAAAATPARQVVTGSKTSTTPPELLTESYLQQVYANPMTFELIVFQPLPQDALQLLVKLGLHTTYRHKGWNALHFACAAHRVELVKQLLKAGADVDDHLEPSGLQPLHLACMPKVCSVQQFNALVEAMGNLSQLVAYITAYGPGCPDLVQLLLEEGADANACSDSRITPLHILSCWTGGDAAMQDEVFFNPFLGQAIFCWPDHKPLPRSTILCGCAHGVLEAASTEGLAPGFDRRPSRNGLRTRDCPRFCEASQLGLEKDAQDASLQLGFKDPKREQALEANVQHLQLIKTLHLWDADPDTQALPVLDTPLMLAAMVGNAAAADMLCRMGAWLELRRADGARALELAASKGFCRVGWTLMCHGALAVPDWMRKGQPRLPDVPKWMGREQTWGPAGNDVPFESLPLAMVPNTPEMLVCNAVRCADQSWNLHFLERLLADGASLEGVWPQTGETPLLIAISWKDVEMVCMLVRAGADVNACCKSSSGSPAIAHALLYSKQQEEDAEILQILIDAGADITQLACPTQMQYDMVQYAANRKDVEAALKLVEAGAKWQLPKGQRVIGSTIFYPPEILHTYMRLTKVNYLEGRFKVAEKQGNKKRAAAAAALEPWLSPEVSPEVKEATVRTLVAAGVTPIIPQQRRQQQRQRQPAPPPVKAARWSGCLEQQLQLGLQGAPWDACFGRQQQQLGLGGSTEGLCSGLSSSSTAPAASSSAAVDDKLQSKQQKQVDMTGEDLDALIADLGSVTPAAPGSSKAAASKKKKKETAAQKEAKRQQKLRLQRLQEQQQQQDDHRSSDSEAEGAAVQVAADANACIDTGAGVAEETSTVPQAGVQAGAGTLTGPQGGATAGEQRKQQQQQESLLPSHYQDQPAQVEGQAKPPTKQHKGNKSKAGAHQQQQAGTNSSTAALRQPQGHQTVRVAVGAVQGSVSNSAATPAAAVVATGSDGSTAAVQRPDPAPVAAQTPHAAPAPAPAGASVAAGSADASTGRTSPQPRPAPRPFLPPHLRMSMPAAAAATGNAPVQQTAQVASTTAQRPAVRPQPVQQAQDAQQQQQQQQQQEMPALPSAMMAALAGAAKHPSSAAAAAAAARGKPAGRKGAAAAAAEAGAGAGSRGAGIAKPPVSGIHTVKPAGSSKTPAGGSKETKPCLSCGQRRRNVLLLPCKHIVLCDACADVDSCPSCGKLCTQRIRVHQS